MPNNVTFTENPVGSIAENRGKYSGVLGVLTFLAVAALAVFGKDIYNFIMENPSSTLLGSLVVLSGGCLLGFAIANFDKWGQRMAFVALAVSIAVLALWIACIFTSGETFSQEIIAPQMLIGVGVGGLFVLGYGLHQLRKKVNEYLAPPPSAEQADQDLAVQEQQEQALRDAEKQRKAEVAAKYRSKPCPLNPAQRAEQLATAERLLVASQVEYQEQERKRRTAPARNEVPPPPIAISSDQSQGEKPAEPPVVVAEEDERAALEKKVETKLPLLPPSVPDQVQGENSVAAQSDVQPLGQQPLARAAIRRPAPLRSNERPFGGLPALADLALARTLVANLPSNLSSATRRDITNGERLL